MQQLKSFLFPVLVGLTVAFLAAPPERAAEAEAGQAVAAVVVADASSVIHAAASALAVFGVGAVALPWVTIAGIVAGVGYLVLLRRSQWVRDHRAAIEKAAATAFGIVENLKLTGQLAEDQDKAERAVLEFKRIMLRQNLPVTDQAQAIAQDLWEVMHAATKTAPAPAAVPTPPAA